MLESAFNNLPEAPPLAWLLLAAIPFILIYALQSASAGPLPVINDRGFFEFSETRTKHNFVHNGRALLREGLKRFPGKPFKVLADFGYITILPPTYANELRNNHDLSHASAIAKVWLAGSVSMRW